jgi:peptide/nickel transport system permease protein
LHETRPDTFALEAFEPTSPTAPPPGPAAEALRKGGGMAGAAAGFLTSLALSFFGLTVVTFVIGRVIPIDPVLAIVGDHATRDVYERTRTALGFDRSIAEQYLIYLGRLAHGDLCISFPQPSSWRPPRSSSVCWSACRRA